MRHSSTADLEIPLTVFGVSASRDEVSLRERRDGASLPLLPLPTLSEAFLREMLAGVQELVRSVWQSRPLLLLHQNRWNWDEIVLDYKLLRIDKLERVPALPLFCLLSFVRRVQLRLKPWLINVVQNWTGIQSAQV